MYETLKKVLIVDDALDQSLVMERFVTGLGPETCTAKDGLQAIERLQNAHFDLIITDLEMPRMNGIQLIEWCRSHALFIPIILLTANIERLKEKQFDSIDCCSVVIRKKPVDFVLMKMLVNAADQHRHDESCTFRSFKEAIDLTQP